MDRIPISSSMIRSVGYDLEALTLEVEFKNGDVYQYYDVPESEYNMIVNSSSPGRYLKTSISNVYQFQKI